MPREETTGRAVAQERVEDGVDVVAQLELVDHPDGEEFVGEERCERVDPDTRELVAKSGKLEMVAHAGEVGGIQRVIEPQDDHVGSIGSPEGHAIEYIAERVEDEIERGTVRLVYVHPLCVDASLPQARTGRGEEIAAEEHFDTRHPRVRRLGHHDVVRPLASQERAVRVAPHDPCLWIPSCTPVVGFEDICGLDDARRDLRDHDLLDGFEAVEHTHRVSGPVADDEGAFRLREQSRDEGGESHRAIVAGDRPIGLPVRQDCERLQLFLFEMLEHGHGGRWIVGGKH